MKWKKPLYFIIGSIIFYFIFINDPFYFIWGKKYGKGVITYLDTNTSLGDFVIYYSFELSGENFDGKSTVGSSRFLKGNLQIGDTVNCIYYCPCFPDITNGLKFYYYMNPNETLKMKEEEQEPLFFIEGCD